MNVASRELCQELYEMSGWDSSLAGGNARWCLLGGEQWELLRLSDAEAYQPMFTKEWFAGVPAYDLGYLLRKLPVSLEGGLHPVLENDDANWTIEYYTRQKSGPSASANTPEDAACKLAIELFKQGVLSAPQSTGEQR